MPSSPPTVPPVAPSRVPEPLIRAEVAAFPLTSEGAFRGALIELDPALERTQPTFDLWRACETRFSEHASGLSLDRLVAIRDHTWFRSSARDLAALEVVRMHTYLRELADMYFLRRYGVTKLHLQEGPGAEDEEVDAAVRYQWLTFSLPEDMLLAAIRIDPPPTRVDLGHPLFERRMLDQGAVEIHQHGGAGWEFPLIWVGGLAALAAPDLSPDAMRSAGAPLREGQAFPQWLLAAAVTRVVLAEFLMTPVPPDSDETLERFLRARSEGYHRHAQHTLEAAVRAVCSGADHNLPTFEALHALYRDLHPMGVHLAADPPRGLDEVWKCDPIAVRRRMRANYGDGERWLIRRGLAYLESCEARMGRRDDAFARAFWQLQRLRCFCYQFVVERPLTAGLIFFIRFYNRSHPLRRPLRNLQPEASFRISGRDQPVMTALEMRHGLERDAIAFAESLRTMIVSWLRTLESSTGVLHRGCEPEFGLIVTINKVRDRDEAWVEGRPMAFGEHTYAQPHGPRRGERQSDSAAAHGAWRRRYHEFFSSQGPKAMAMASVLSAVPIALWMVRGVDVSADELGVPTWVLVPLFHFLRERAAYASVLLKARTGQLAPGAPFLQTTAHVGEDFRHLTEGMRRIYEAVEHLLARSGGRLGHAMALGIEPRRWAESVGSVLMPREDRLWDLVFEWRLYNGFGVPRAFAAFAAPGRSERVQNMIAEIARTLWGRDPHELGPRELAEFQDELHGFMIPPGSTMMTAGDLERALERGSHRRRAKDHRQAPDLLLRYLEDPDFYRAGQQLVDVPLDDSEVAGMTAVQEALRRGIAQRRIVVEVNPTSNLLIGDVLDLRHHPLLRLFPVEPHDDSPSIPVAVGSDDPLTFSTSLAGEYAMLYEAARGAGYATAAVERWLDRIRQTAFDARFTCPWRPNARTMARDIKEALDRYLQRPESVARRARQCRARMV